MPTINKTLDLWKRLTNCKCGICGKKIKRNTLYCSSECLNKALDRINLNINDFCEEK